MTRTKPNAAPKRMSFEDRRRSIIEAACRVIAEKGIDSFRIVDVADTAGVSQPLVSRHFTSRDELMVAAFRSSQDAADAELRDRETETDSGAQRVLNWLCGTWDTPSDALLTDLDMWYQVWGNRTLSPTMSELVVEIQTEWIEALENRVREAIADGSAAPDIDPYFTARYLAAVADGIPPALVHGTMTRTEARAIIVRAVEHALGK